MTAPFTSGGAKTPPKPFTMDVGHRKVRSFVLRRAARTIVFDMFRRVATRQLDPHSAAHLESAWR